MTCFCCDNYFVGSGTLGRVACIVGADLTSGARYLEYGLCVTCIDAWFIALPVMDVHHPRRLIVRPQSCWYCGNYAALRWQISMHARGTPQSAHYTALCCAPCLENFSLVRDIVKAAQL